MNNIEWRQKLYIFNGHWPSPTKQATAAAAEWTFWMQINTFFVINDAFKFVNVHMFVNFLFFLKSHSHSRVIGLAHCENIHTWKFYCRCCLFFIYSRLCRHNLGHKPKKLLFIVISLLTLRRFAESKLMSTLPLEKSGNVMAFIVHLTRDFMKRTMNYFPNRHHHLTLFRSLYYSSSSSLSSTFQRWPSKKFAPR